jgi:hypothetical protein
MFNFGITRELAMLEFGAHALFFRGDPTGLYMNGDCFVAIVDTSTGTVRGAVRLSDDEVED